MPIKAKDLFDGRVMHRGSEGNALEITPGAMNIMTAGRGIAHSERSPLSARRAAEVYSVFKAGSRFRRRMRKSTRPFSISTP
jgi:redox-sensitive bicupin YhaK (pirin superfamily)